jgi:hypothetical protein
MFGKLIKEKYNFEKWRKDEINVFDIQVLYNVIEFLCTN